jgi:hypothetical protein
MINLEKIKEMQKRNYRVREIGTKYETNIEKVSLFPACFSRRVHLCLAFAFSLHPDIPARQIVELLYHPRIAEVVELLSERRPSGPISNLMGPPNFYCIICIY